MKTHAKVLTVQNYCLSSQNQSERIRQLPDNNLKGKGLDEKEK